MKLLGILITVVCFLLLVTGHEFGHFGVAKFLGMKVNEFSVGMGPLLWNKKKGETQYSLRAIPLGGYCMLEGEDDDSDDPRSFSKQPAWAKILVLIAGPLVNIILGIAIFSFLFTYSGTSTPTLSKVIENGPAYEAGIRAGDTILAIDGNEYSDFSSLRNAIRYSKGDTITVTIKRDGEVFDIKTGFYLDESNYRGIGIMSGVTHDFIPCVKAGIRETATVAIDVKNFFTGLFKGTTNVNEVAGVIGIVAIAGSAAESGGLINVIYIIALVSANLGYMNLLPVPALDGGRILFTILRAIFRNKFVDKIEVVFNAIGIVILLGLTVIIMFKDVLGLFL